MTGSTPALRGFLVVTGVATLLAASSARAAESTGFTDAERRLIAPALVDYGLLYGLSLTNPQPSDAEYVLIWLEAATLADPNFLEGWDWIYDLRGRLGQHTEAMHALRQRVRLDPANLPARFDLFAAEYESAQTAEERMTLCTRVADDASAPAVIRAEALRRLALLHQVRKEPDAALRRARAAIELAPRDVAAKTVLADLENRLSAPLTQVDLLLADLVGNPNRGDSAWQLARICSRLGLHAEAQTWFARSEEMLQRLAPDGELPPAFVLDKAEAAANAGLDDDAARACLEVHQRNPGDIDAGLMLVFTARRAGGVMLADDTAAAIANRLRELESPALARGDADTCLRIARFHLEVDRDPRRAVEFARRADAFRPGDPAIRETLGAALVAAGDFAEAAEILEPLAAADARAAASLARARFALSDRAGAQRAIRTAESLPAGPLARARIADVLRELGLSPAPRPEHADIKARLAAFDARVLDFPNRPADFLALEARLDASQLPFGAPLHATTRLVNKGPFAITLADGGMVPPLVGVSLAEEETDGLRVNNYLVIPLDTKQVLAPGESIEVTRRISASAGRTFLQHQPQRRRHLQVRFVLAPGEDVTRSQLPGVDPVSVGLTRLPVDATSAGLARLRKLLQTGSPEERFIAVETILALVFERQESLQVKRPHDYPAAVVNVDTLVSDLLPALRDPLPAIRARALAAMIYMPLGEQAVAAAAPLITDPHWLPRLMAIEMFVRQQGRVFAKVLQKQTGDDHHLVSALANLYLARVPAPPAP